VGVESVIRLYFNKRGELPWSTDNGPGTVERTHRRVLISAPGICVSKPEAGDNKNTPTAWIVFGDVEERFVGPGYIDIRRLNP
jgi:hypothetical protein